MKGEGKGAKGWVKGEGWRRGEGGEGEGEGEKG